MTATDLATLHALCFTTPRPWSSSEFTDLLASKGVFLCTRPQGFALGRIAGPEVELLTLAVHPNARRNGIAQDLLHEFLQTAQKKAATQAFLEVSTTNKAAIALYQCVGFTQAGHRKDYYTQKGAQKVSALVMTRQLIGIDPR
jgi:[ribosomal protein S18]-alanine N-acetyltransferase